MRKISVVPVKQKDQCSCLVGDLEKHSRNSEVCDLVASGEWRERERVASGARERVESLD
jgi:hypothetical protein